MSWPGAYQGVVLSTSDPQGLGRVRLQVPQVSGNAGTGWVPPIQQGGARPGVGDLVWVIYQAGDPSYPVYLPPIPGPTDIPDPPVWQIDPAPVVTGMTLGNGSISSRYLIDGHTVRWTVGIVWGTTTTASPSNAITVSVPVPADPDSGVRWASSVLINPASGSAWKPGAAWLFPPAATLSIEALRQSDLGFVPFSTAGLSVSSTGWISVQITYDRV